MKVELFRQMLREERQRLLALNKSKGRDYSGDDDALAFFKEQARELGMSAQQGWAVLARKHWSAILTYCRMCEDDGYQPSENIEGRIRDLILYLFLLLALATEADSDDDGFNDEGDDAPSKMGDLPSQATPIRLWVCPRHGPLRNIGAKSCRHPHGAGGMLCYKDCDLVTYEATEVPSDTADHAVGRTGRG